MPCPACCGCRAWRPVRRGARPRPAGRASLAVTAAPAAATMGPGTAPISLSLSRSLVCRNAWQTSARRSCCGGLAARWRWCAGGLPRPLMASASPLVLQRYRERGIAAFDSPSHWCMTWRSRRAPSRVHCAPTATTSTGGWRKPHRRARAPEGVGTGGLATLRTGARSGCIRFDEMAPLPASRLAGQCGEHYRTYRSLAGAPAERTMFSATGGRLIFRRVGIVHRRIGREAPAQAPDSLRPLSRARDSRADGRSSRPGAAWARLQWHPRRTRWSPGVGLWPARCCREARCRRWPASTCRAVCSHVSGVDVVRTPNAGRAEGRYCVSGPALLGGVSPGTRGPRMLLLLLLLLAVEAVRCAQVAGDLAGAARLRPADQPARTIAGTHARRTTKNAYQALSGAKMGVELVEGRTCSPRLVDARTRGRAGGRDPYRRSTDGFLDWCSGQFHPGLRSAAGRSPRSHGRSTGPGLSRECFPARIVLAHLDLVVKEVHGAGGYGMLVGPAATATRSRQFRAGASRPIPVATSRSRRSAVDPPDLRRERACAGAAHRPCGPVRAQPRRQMVPGGY